MPGAEGLQQAAKHVLSIFAATQSSNYQEQRDAESALLRVRASEPQYALAVLHAVGDERLGAPAALRQLAAIMLRQHVEANWDSAKARVLALRSALRRGEEPATLAASSPPRAASAGRESVADVPVPDVPEAVKARIREQVLPLLGQEDSKIRTAVSMVVGKIALFDYPARWPKLLDVLVQMLTSDDAKFVEGALRALALFVESITTEQLGSALPALLPALLRVVSHPDTFAVQTRTQALVVYRRCVLAMHWLSDSEQAAETVRTHLLFPTLAAWMAALQMILNAPFVDPNSGRPADWALRHRAVSVLYVLFVKFRDEMASQLSGVCQLLWKLLQALVPLFEEHFANAAYPPELEFDIDGNETGFEAFLAQVLEVFGMVCEIGQADMLRPVAPELVRASLSCMVATTRELEAWEANCNEYMLAQHSETQDDSVRLSALNLIMWIVNAYGRESIALVQPACMERLQLAQALHGQQHPNWWKPQEVAMHTLGFLVNSARRPQDFNVLEYATQVLLPFMETKWNGHPYVRARAVACASTVVPKLLQTHPQVVMQFLRGVVQALAPSSPMPVRLMASHSFGLLCATNGFLENPRPLLEVLPEGLTHQAELLTKTTANSLHTLLESICLALSLDRDFTAGAEASVTPLMLTAWQQHPADREVCEAVVDVLGQLAMHERSNQGVQERLVPFLANLLTSPDENAANMIVLRTAIDLLRAVAHGTYRNRAPAHPSLYSHCLPAVLVFLLRSPDTGLLDSGAGCVADLLLLAPQEAQKVVIDGRPLLQVLCSVVERLLDPFLDPREVGCSKLGRLVSVMLRLYFGAIDQVLMANLLRTVAQRLYSAEYIMFIDGLVIMFVRLLRSHGNSMVRFLAELGDLSFAPPPSSAMRQAMLTAAAANQPVPQHQPQQVSVNLLQLVLDKWMESCAHDKIVGTYHKKISITTLFSLLATNNPAVMNVVVQGYAADNPDFEQYCRAVEEGHDLTNVPQPPMLIYPPMPFPAKVVSVLVREWQSQRMLKARRAHGGRSHEEALFDQLMGLGDDDDFGDDDDDDAAFRALTAQAVRDSVNSAVFAEAPGHDDDNGDDDGVMFHDLSDMLDGVGGYGDDAGDMGDAEDELMDLDIELLFDPLDSLDLETFVHQSLRQLSTEASDLLHACAQHLNESDKRLLDECLSSPPQGELTPSRKQRERQAWRAQLEQAGRLPKPL